MSDHQGNILILSIFHSVGRCLRLRFVVLILYVISTSFSLAIETMAADMPLPPLKGMQLGKASLDISGSIRFRYEYRNNFSIKRYEDAKDNYLLERFRLEFNLKTGKGLRTFIQFQDAHCLDCAYTPSDFQGSCPTTNEFDVRQAFLEWSELNSNPIGFKMGRQQINYRDNRIFGPGQWGNVGRYSWDALLFKYEAAHINLDSFFAKRIFYLPEQFLDDHYPYDVYALYGQIKKLPFDLDAFYTYKYNSADNDKYGKLFKEEKRHTSGFYVKGKQPIGKDSFLSYSGLYAYQTGSYPGRAQRISAYGGYANLGIHGKPVVPQGFWGRYSYGSGDKNPDDNKVQTFDGIFGAIDKYYGRMNFFSWMNLEDYQLTYQIEPIRRLKITVDHHWFRVAQNHDAWYYGNGKPARTAGHVAATESHDLGTEWDLFAVYDLNKSLQLQLGYCHFIPGAVIVKSGFYERSNYMIFQVFYKF